MLDTYDKLRELVAAIEDDVKKASGGNKAAGTRVRKQLQEVKNLSQDLRKQVLENREEEAS